MERPRTEQITHLPYLESLESYCHQHILRSIRPFWLAGLKIHISHRIAEVGEDL